jgi:acetoin utilization protein AcuC
MCEIIYHPDYKKYDLGAGHPFNPVRAEMVLDFLKRAGQLKEPLKPEPVTAEDLESVHDKSYIRIVEAASCGQNLKEAEDYGLGTLDNPIAKGMAEGARLQIGGTLMGARLLIENKANKILQFGGGFHHAHRTLAAGFCIYNDLGLAIKELTKEGLHIAYLDLDVHHGDGVQEIFYSDENVLTISLHESGEYLFPGTGWVHELGNSMGRSLKLNVPLEPFTEGDSYLEIINGIVEPALKWFKPDAIIVQAGADAHFSDPLADLMLTTQDFEKIFKRVIELADQYCKKKVLFTLGGGYSITATPRIWIILYLILFGLKIPEKLPEDWRIFWQEKIKKDLPEFLHDPIPSFQPIPRKKEIEKHNHELIQRLMDAVAPYWI